MKIGAFGGAVLFVVSFRAATAGAAAPRDIRVHLPECATAPFDYEELIDVLRVELAPGAIVARALPGVDIPDVSVELEVSCRLDPEVVTLRVGMLDRHRVPRSALRTMDIRDLPMGTRPRGIAVIVAEIVRSLEGIDPLRAAPPPTGAPSPQATAPADPPSAGPHGPHGPHLSSRPIVLPAPPSATPRDTGPASSARPAEGQRPAWDVRAGAEARVFVSQPTALVGGSLGARISSVHLGFDVLRGVASDPLGRTTVTLVGASLGLELWRLGTGRFDLSFLPRVGAGLLVAEALPVRGASSHTAREPYLDAAIALDGRLRLGARTWGTFGVELGYARGFVITANDRVVAQPDGPFFACRLGIAFAP